MIYMFSGCSSLTALDLSSFNTQNVTEMEYMFSGCSSLTALDVSGFNTQNVTRMDGMFYNCSGLTSLDLSSFNTQNVANMSSMFSGCNGLTSLDMSGFDTQNVTDMNNMFNSCSGLTSLDLSGFNTQNVTNMRYMFYGCSSLTALDLSSFNTQNVTDMSGMFSGCSGLTSLDVSGFNTQNVTEMSSMFYDTGSAIIFIPANAKEEILSQRDFNMVLKAEDGSFSCANFVPAEDIEFDIPYTFTATITDSGHLYNSHYVIGWNTKPDGTGITYQVGQENATIHKGKTTFYPIYPSEPQAIWTKGNTTLTFLSSEKLYAPGDDFNGQTVTNVWSGEDVTNSPTSAYSYPNWNSSVNSSLTTVVFDESFKNIKPQSTAYWFNRSKLQSIEGIKNLNTQNVTSMDGMFSGCSGLTSLDLSSFNTQNVTDMDWMFSGCSGLTSLDFSGFNIQNVTSMFGMFYDCSGLTSIDLSSFNTQNVTSMGYMFYGCSGLTSLDVSGFNTQNVTRMDDMFAGCSGLTSLDLSSFNTQNVTKMSFMFYGCSGLTSLDLSSFNTQNVTDMSYMFYDCSGLTSIDLSSFNTQNVTSAGSMFTDSAIIFISADASQTILSGRKFNMVLKAEDGSFSCANFVPKENMEFDIPYTFAAKITDTGHIYEVRYVIGWNTKADGTGITYQTGQTDAVIYKGKTTFYPIAFGRAPQAVWTAGNTTLTFLLSSETPYTVGDDFNGQTVTEVWSTKDVIKYSSGGTSKWSKSVQSSLTTVVFDESFKDVRPQSTNDWFRGCSKLQSIEGIEYLNTENVTDMGGMFSGCSGLTSLDLSSINTQNVTDMGGMFSGCSGLTSLDLSSINTQNVTDMSSMFSGCSGLTSLDLSSINTQNVTDMSSMFYGCSGLTSLDLSNFNTQNVTDMYSMFRGCSGLTSLDLSNFNTQNVKDMSYMFSGCSGLTSLDLSSFNTQNVTDMSYMFYDCSGLTSIDLSSFNTQNVTSAGSMFTDSAIIFISADASQTILSGRKFNMVLKAEDGSFSCANFVPKENMEFDIPYTFAAKITDTGHIYEVRYVIGWNTKADGTGITYQTGQTDAVIYKGKTTFYPIAFGRVPLAVWTEGNTTLTFLLSYDTPFTAGEGLNGQAVTKVWSESDVTNSPTSPRWNSSVSSSLTTVVFDESFKDVKPQSTNRWFSGCSKLQSIEGIENLNTENVTIMSYMFSGCSGLPSLDLSNFNTQNVTNMNSMFNNTGSAIIFIPADTKQNILSQRDFNMVLKAADDSFSCENFVPIDSVELNIPYAFTATLTSEAPQKEGLTFTGWNTMSDGSGTNYVPGQTDAVIEKGLVTFYPIFYDPTNIQMQQAERTGDTRYYNLRGMRMEQPRKGLNITVDKNGRSRKVMMR